MSSKTFGISIVVTYIYSAWWCTLYEYVAQNQMRSNHFDVSLVHIPVNILIKAAYWRTKEWPWKANEGEHLARCSSTASDKILVPRKSYLRDRGQIIPRLMYIYTP